MHVIDVRPVESSTGIASTKSGDAIAIRFTPDTGGPPKVIIIDDGFTDNGKDLVDHVVNVNGTRHVDLVICTHPDRDHIGGLCTVVEELDFNELLLHQPRLHARAAFLDFAAEENILFLTPQRRYRSSSRVMAIAGVGHFARRPAKGFIAWEHTNAARTES